MAILIGDAAAGAGPHGRAGGCTYGAIPAAARGIGSRRLVRWKGGLGRALRSTVITPMEGGAATRSAGSVFRCVEAGLIRGVGAGRSSVRRPAARGPYGPPMASRDSITRPALPGDVIALGRPKALGLRIVRPIAITGRALPGGGRSGPVLGPKLEVRAGPRRSSLGSARATRIRE